MTDRIAVSLCFAGALMTMGVANCASAVTTLPFRTEKPLCGSDMSAKDAVIMTDRILHSPMSKASQAQANNCVVIAAIGGAASAQAMLGAHYAQSGYYRANISLSPLIPQDVEAAIAAPPATFSPHLSKFPDLGGSVRLKSLAVRPVRGRSPPFWSESVRISGHFGT